MACAQQRMDAPSSKADQKAHGPTVMDCRSPPDRILDDSSWITSRNSGLGNDFTWTTGSDPEVRHKRIIDLGGSGEVHEVSLSILFVN